MKIIVLRKMKYEGVYIYVMQFEYVFQYLFTWQGEIYQNHVIVKPNLKSRLLYILRLRPLYTVEQIEEGEKIALSGAMESIDKVIKDSGKSRNINRAKERLDKKTENKDCLWQARDVHVKKDNKVIEEKYYVCLTHGEAVKIKDDEKPSHK